MSNPESTPAELYLGTPFRQPMVESGFKRPITGYIGPAEITILKDTDKIVRLERMTSKNLDQEIIWANKWKTDLQRLRDLGVHVPNVDIVVSSSQGELNTTCYVVVDRIYGSRIDKMTPEQSNQSLVRDKFDQFYAAYAQSIWNIEQLGTYTNLDFIHGGEMFMYGRKMGETEDNVYLVDIGSPRAGQPSEDKIPEPGLCLTRMMDFYTTFAAGYPMAKERVLEYLRSLPEDRYYQKGFFAPGGTVGETIKMLEGSKSRT